MKIEKIDQIELCDNLNCQIISNCKLLLNHYFDSALIAVDESPECGD